jgi:N-hydroxyarylamine O-acetyltransferase
VGEPEPAAPLAPGLTERVLAKLELRERPAADLDGLGTLYEAWCRQVPFDNVRKLIALRAGPSVPLPGSEPTAFFEDWLAHGTGGTCWAGNGALHALLRTVGFASVRGVATMLVNADARANHGTVLVTCGGRRYLLDASILHGAPLPLEQVATRPAQDAPWSVRARLQEGRWIIRWRPLHLPTGLECRIEWLDATHASFQALYEKTRPWSPFNYALYARRNRADAVIGVAFGKRVAFSADGAIHEAPVDARERIRVLVEELGISEALAQRLPPDTPVPPAPGAAAAP